MRACTFAWINILFCIAFLSIPSQLRQAMALTKPTLNSPSNHATLTDATNTFKWSHPYSDKYELKIKTKGGTLKYASGKTSSKSKTVDLSKYLSPKNEYKWYVVVYANGTDDSSDDWWFTYEPRITKPISVSPANNATITDSTCTFTWTHPYDDQYELKIKDSSGNIVYASGKTTSKSKTVDLNAIPLNHGKTYKWYVVVYANGLEDSSEDRYFIFNPQITKPELDNPKNDVVLTDAVNIFTWSHPYDDQYELKIKTKGGTLKYASGKIKQKSLQVDLSNCLAAGSEYRWYVVVYANGLIDSSEDRWFKYDPRITKPVSTSPIDGITINNRKRIFSWSHPYNDKYELKIKNDSGNIIYQSGKTSEKSITIDLDAIPLQDGATYKWYVVVYANGLETSSEDRHFVYHKSDAISTNQIYALTVGIRSYGYLYAGPVLIYKKPDYLWCDLGATKMQEKFSNITSPSHIEVVTGNMTHGGVSKQTIKEKIDDIKSKIHAGDLFILYIHTHGFILPHDDDSSEIRYLLINENLDTGSPYPDGALTVFELASYLDNMSAIHKWVILDACYSGGFWSNGGLGSLKNISLLAAAGKDEQTHFRPYNFSIFTEGLAQAFSKDTDGHLNADRDNNGLTFDELYEYMAVWWTQTQEFQKLIGTPVVDGGYADNDPVPFTGDMWAVTANRSSETVSIRKKSNISPVLHFILDGKN